MLGGSFPYIDQKSQPKEIIMLQPETIDVRREKIFIPKGMTPKKIREKYGLKHSASYNAKKKVFSSRTI